MSGTSSRSRAAVVRGPVLVAWVAWNLPRFLVAGVIRLWRLAVSPLYGTTCKYYPSCSAYGLHAVVEHGALRGLGLAGWRLLRCNPWSHGGVDDVPPARPRLALTRWLDAAVDERAAVPGGPDLADDGSGRSAPEPSRLG